MNINIRILTPQINNEHYNIYSNNIHTATKRTKYIIVFFSFFSTDIELRNIEADSTTKSIDFNNR